MPNITLDGPKVDDIDKKRQLVQDITEIAHKYYGIPKSAFVVVIKENEPHNVGVAGKLVSDNKK